MLLDTSEKPELLNSITLFNYTNRANENALKVFSVKYSI